MSGPFRAALVLVAGFAALLCSACGQDSGPPQAAEVEGTRDCPAPRCISRGDAARELGFTIWEPTALPEGFEIYERVIRTPRIGQSPPGTGPGQSSLGDAPPTLTTLSLPRSLYLEYRFHESLNVPALFVVESALAQPGTEIKLNVRAAECGELLEGDGSFVYVHGSAVAEPGASEAEWWVCKVDEAPARDSHTVLLTRGHVLIEVVAFPQAGVTREDILRLVRSFAESE